MDPLESTTWIHQDPLRGSTGIHHLQEEEAREIKLLLFLDFFVLLFFFTQASSKGAYASTNCLLNVLCIVYFLKWLL